MNSIWAVARHTLSQCLRMKIAVAFLLLLAAGLAILPLVMTGDGTLAGKIRTALSYGVGITGVLLSILTVLVTVAVVSGDIQQKHIQLLAVKPLARWQYLLGRWLGVVLLNAALLGVAAVTIYLIAQHLRGSDPASAVDHRTIETEIFTARAEVKPQPPNIGKLVRKRIEKLKVDGRFDDALQTYAGEVDRKGKTPQERLYAELLKQELSRIETAGPMGAIGWRFKDLDLAGRETKAYGTVKISRADVGQFRISVPTPLAGKLVYRGPVRIDDISGQVISLGRDWFDVRFGPDVAKRQHLLDLRKGSTVEVTVEPTIQFRYKAQPTVKLPAGKKQLHRVLYFGPPMGKPIYIVAGSGPTGTPTTMTVPAAGAVVDGKLQVVYRNIPAPPTGPSSMVFMPPSVRISSADVSVLYRVGGFEANYIRSVLLVFCQLVFLAALGVFFGSFLSFPVATMACMVLLGGGLIFNWLSEAVGWYGQGGEFDFSGFVGNIVLTIIKVLMPNLSETSPADKLVDGIYISWASIGWASAWAVGARATLYLGLGCWIFHKRELAHVQV
ncbi:MAG: hypothetical protein K8S55_12200 [Phycisphaerae bacterium]|nr:hypothetical protein [Phycisphaerae bacterium]